MKKSFICAAGTIMLLSGCGTTTTIYDPATEKHGLRQERNISSEEFREVAAAAVKSAMTNPKFTGFLEKYKTEEKNPAAVPVLKLDRVVNETDDPDLNVSELTDIINEELLNSGKVDVTMAEGAGRSQAIADSRKLRNDADFDQSTVAKSGTLAAARLVMRPKVISNTVKDGRKTAVTRTFVMEMADVKTGLIMWKFTKQLGFGKEKPLFGF